MIVFYVIRGMMTAEIGPHVKATLNFTRTTADSLVTTALLQSYLDKFLELFLAATGSVNDSVDDVSSELSMACAQNQSYNRRLSGEPVEFEARLTVLESVKSVQERCSIASNDT
jgi:hypothetical protein